jgi:two-component system, cell cycle sensor histidine kinase and response regulator CckA
MRWTKVVRTLLSRLRDKLAFRSVKVRIGICIILVLILSILTYMTYYEYKKTIVAQQQQNMLLTSRSISRSLELFTNEVTDSVKIITLDKDFIKAVSNSEQMKAPNVSNEKLISFYTAQGKAIDAVCFFDKNGRLLTQYPQGFKNADANIKDDINTVIDKKNTYIGKVYMDKERNIFILNIYQPVFDGEDFKGVVSVAIRLDVLYDKLIAPVKIGEKGYAMVKDQNGIIIMHPVKEQVGMDVIETRKQVFPDLDYKELEDLIKNQLTGSEGTAIYHSYWWGDNVLKKVKKLSAYTPVQFGEHFWVVALTTSYDEIQGPINQFLMKIIAIDALIAIIIYVFVSALIKMKKNKEELEKETKYLKMLNETSEQLRKKEAELYHSQKLKMIGTLAGGIAHDINNLLTPILGYSELMLMRIPQNSEYYEEVDEIYKASKKGKDLIEEILVFSRNDKEITKIEPINVNEVISETMKLLKAILPKNVKVQEDINKQYGYVKANFTQIHQVIFNLCTNAFQSIKNKDGLVKISLTNIKGTKAHEINKSLLKHSDYMVITVEDNGCGMDEETIARIFDPFFTTKTVGEGTGLGLFVVHNIIDKYKGAITVESKIGIGSCFKVYLPLMEKETIVENSKHIESVQNVDKTILIVDDNVKVAKVLKKGLEHLGFEVVSETDSLKALKLFEADNNRFDLIISDYMMPGLNGCELAAKIKEIKKNTGVIIMTGYMDENEKAINNSKAVDAFILKPIELAKLSKLIQKVLKN